MNGKLLSHNKDVICEDTTNFLISKGYILKSDVNGTKCCETYETMDKYLTRFRNNKPYDKRNLTYYFTNKVYLFIVNYHHLNYTSAFFIRNVIYNLFALYYPYDFDLLLVGPTTDEQLKVLGNGLPKFGAYSYHSMTIAYDVFSPDCGYNYAGYFLANDDSCLQPIYLGKENHDQAMAEDWRYWTNKTYWKWNHVRNMNKVVYQQAFFEAIDEINDSPTTNTFCWYNKSLLRRGWGDFYYVPKTKVESYLKLEEIMFKHKVFLEVAVPSMMQCLDANIIRNCNHGRMTNRENCVHLHPVKYSRIEEKSICINRITNLTLQERPKTWYSVC